jgi:hypothetical protein
MSSLREAIRQGIHQALAELRPGTVAGAVLRVDPVYLALRTLLNDQDYIEAPADQLYQTLLPLAGVGFPEKTAAFARKLKTFPPDVGGIGILNFDELPFEAGKGRGWLVWDRSRA